MIFSRFQKACNGQLVRRMPKRSHATAIDKYNCGVAHWGIVPGAHPGTIAGGWLSHRSAAFDFKESRPNRQLAECEIPLVDYLAGVKPGGRVTGPIGQNRFREGFPGGGEGNV